MENSYVFLTMENNTDTSSDSSNSIPSPKRILKNLLLTQEVDDDLRNACLAFMRHDKELSRKVLCLESLVNYLNEEKLRIENCYIEAEKAKVAIENEKKSAERYVRKLACPAKIRHIIELFPLNFILSVEDANRRINEIHIKLETIRNNYKKANSLLCSCIELAYLTLKTEEEIAAVFPKTWKCLSLMNLNLIHLPSSSPLQKTLIELHKAQDATSARQIWKSNENVLKPRALQLSSEDIEQIAELTKSADDLHSKILDGALSDFFQDQCEKEYAMDLLKIGKLSTTNVPKFYKLCKWILYTSHDPDIEKLRKKLDTEWSDRDRANRYDLYSTLFAKLYNIVSELDKHGLRMVPFDQYEPSVEDYQEYVKHLSALDDGKFLAFVAQTLVQPL